MFDSLYIDDFCNFNRFDIDFIEKENTEINLNILVGQNGSGKSCFLDALFEIGKNNLKSKSDKKTDNTAFEYEIKNKNNILLSNMNKDIANEPFWDTVIRFHTGHTQRQNEENNTNVISINADETKWAFLAYILSGHWQNSTDKEIWEIIQKTLTQDENKKIEPKIIWIEAEGFDYEKNKNYWESSFNLRAPDSYVEINNDKIRFFWNLSEGQLQLKKKSNKGGIINPLPTLIQLLYKINPDSFSENMNGKFTNTGFLYSKGDGPLLSSQTLSDGEHGFFNRFALFLLLKEETKRANEKFLILLDEPETHFNEYWKTEFLHLICKIFSKTSHDIFIATHSAMLVTDAKPNEINRLENRANGTKHIPIPIKTYGANVIDIGQSLFKMEADIGNRSREDITRTLKGVGKNGENLDIEKQKKALDQLIHEVGPGEWRWRLRAKLNEIEKRENCIYLQAKNNED